MRTAQLLPVLLVLALGCSSEVDRPDQATQPAADEVNATTKSEPFDEFITRFCSDRAFRYSRTNWPLETSFVYLEDDGEYRDRVAPRDSIAFAKHGFYHFGGADCSRPVDEWDYDYWLYDLFSNFEADSTLEPRADQRAVQFTSDDSGLRALYYFQLSGGQWRMIRLADHTI